MYSVIEKNKTKRNQTTLTKVQSIENINSRNQTTSAAVEYNYLEIEDNI